MTCSFSKHLKIRMSHIMISWQTELFQGRCERGQPAVPTEFAIQMIAFLVTDQVVKVPHLTILSDKHDFSLSYNAEC